MGDGAWRALALEDLLAILYTTLLSVSSTRARTVLQRPYPFSSPDLLYEHEFGGDWGVSLPAQKLLCCVVRHSRPLSEPGKASEVN